MNSERQGPAAALSGPASRKLPVPPRERRPALAALALLLILGGALATTLLVLRSGDRVSAIQIVQQVGTGQRIPRAAMREVQIADTGIGYVAYADSVRVSEHYARVTLLPGTLLTREMVVSASAELGPGKARVGLALKPGQLPANLAQGDRVQVIHVPGRGGGAGAQSRVLAQAALVHSVGGQSKSGLSGQVTIIVDATVSPTIAAYASNGEIALAELPGAR
ncbi:MULTISPECIES: hypothetical protein [Streptosporangium]|uniref:SAF domain-containing protein n=1 Tax=Streptosporangium brasiliense TaxID=47480 RepID=A0ABT9R224_9ACTN|nr:hypothetical protein [Streptosporangium brasiliense]MDP9862864.1 hypothetical protein [Streptosporangium brasiliense]